MKSKLTVYLLCFFASVALWAETDLPSQVDYPFELVKHYLSAGELDLALQTAKQFHNEVAASDSLAWMMATAYLLQHKPDSAAIEYNKVISISSDSLLVNSAAVRILKLIPHISSNLAVKILAESTKHVYDDDMYLKLIFKLAELYEEIFLFYEANDIYLNLIDSEFLVDKNKLLLKVSTNLVFAKKYHKALDYADQIVVNRETDLTYKALFTKYICYQALKDTTNTLNTLLKLYLEYPKYNSLWKINYDLAKLLNHKGFMLPAWYVLETYYPMADRQEKKIIIDFIREIKDNISVDSQKMNNFRLFVPNLQKLLEE